MNPFNRNAALWIVIVLLLALLYSVFQGGTTRTAGNTISYSDFVRAVDQRQVQDVRISGNTITGTFREPRNGVQKFATYAPSTPPDEQLMPNLIKNVDRVDAGPAEEGVNLGSIFVSWLPVLVLVARLHLLPAPDAERHRPAPWASASKSRARLTAPRSTAA